MSVSTDEALQIMDQSYKEILIQAGKHFRVMARDGPGGLIDGIQAKSADALSQYHMALSQIESEIILAKSVLLRDLENIRAGRASGAVAMTPVPLIPLPQPAAPPAPMMELPSSAAHSHSLNTSVTIPVPVIAPTTAIYPPSMETRTVAPFPDMGVGMSTDVVDLTAMEKKPSPRVQAGKPIARSNAPSSMLKQPPPKPAPKPMPPAKVTPVPPPQIPRLQSFPSSNTATQPKPQLSPQLHKAAQVTQTVQAARQVVPPKVIQDKAVGGRLDLPPTAAATAAINMPSVGTGSGSPNFTNMEFSLAATPGKPKGAPPAPMPKFDLATVTPQPPMPNATKGNNVARRKVTQPMKPASNMDDLFNLGDPSKGGDSMFDLGGGDGIDNTFNDMMYFGGNGNNNNDNMRNNNNDMAKFDDAYFHQ